MPDGNPAERLHRIISRLARGPDNVTMDLVLRQLSTYTLDSEEDDPEPASFTRAELLQMFGALMALPAEIRVAIRRLPPDLEDLDHLAAPLDTVEQALQQYGAYGPWKQYKQRIDGQVVSELRATAQALRRNGWSDHTVTGDQLATLHRHVAELFDEVRQADLDEDLQRFVLRHLDKIERGIRHYQVEGTPPLEDAVDMFVGDMVRDVGEADRRGVRKFVEEDALGRKLMRLIGEVNGIVAFAQWAIDAAAGVPLPPFG